MVAEQETDNYGGLKNKVTKGLESWGITAWLRPSLIYKVPDWVSHPNMELVGSINATKKNPISIVVYNSDYYATSAVWEGDPQNYLGRYNYLYSW